MMAQKSVPSNLPIRCISRLILLAMGVSLVALAVPATANVPPTPVDTPLVGSFCQDGFGPGNVWLRSWLSHVFTGNPDNPINPGGIDDDLVAYNECAWWYNG